MTPNSNIILGDNDEKEEVQILSPGEIWRGDGPIKKLLSLQNIIQLSYINRELPTGEPLAEHLPEFAPASENQFPFKRQLDIRRDILNEIENPGEEYRGVNKFESHARRGGIQSENKSRALHYQPYGEYKQRLRDIHISGW